MEKISLSSHPGSGDSSPHSREIDDNHSTGDPPSACKHKVMCFFGGKIQPRPHDNQLTYVGGDTKLIAVDRNVKFPTIINKLTSLCGSADFHVKYQLPGEDLDNLISITSDEDIENMIAEYERFLRLSTKALRLRLFLFNLKSSVPNEEKSDRQWFVDALNSVNVQNLESSSPPAKSAVVSAENPDFLFGFDNNPAFAPMKSLGTPPTPLPEVVTKDVLAGSECGSEEKNLFGDALVNQQIQDFQRMQMAENNKIDESNSSGFVGEYYVQKVPEKVSMAPVSAAVQAGMAYPAANMREGQVNSTRYPVVNAGTEQPIYLIQAPVLRPVTGQVGPGYYGVQRGVQELYREQPVYNPVPQQTTISVQQQQPVYNPVPQRTTASVQQQQLPKVAPAVVQQKVGGADQGYLQVGYDNTGRLVYYTTQYHLVPVATIGAVDGRQIGGGTVNQDGKVVGANVPQASST